MKMFLVFCFCLCGSLPNAFSFEARESLLSLHTARSHIKITRLDQEGVREEQGPQFFINQQSDNPILVLVGKTLWDLILNNNRPVGVDFDRIQAHALPVGVTDPMVLAPWRGPGIYRVEMGSENMLGMDLFTAQSRVQFYYGAPYQGVGQHLANITIAPESFHSFLGFTGNVKVRLSSPVYKEGQIASTLATIEVNIRGPLDTLTQSDTIELSGDGRIKSIMNR